MPRLTPFILLLTTASLLAQSKSPATSAGALTNAIGMEFVRIEPGEFMMGCSAGDSECKADERPAHRVRITKRFEIGRYEVTQAQWMRVMNANPSTMKSDDRPVEMVTRPEAQDFLARLNGRNDGYRYRLPTEAEWEYSARAGSPSAGIESLDEVAWHAGNSEDESHPVGTKKPNAWGLFDMQGNVREWVADLYTANYYSNSPVDDPTGPVAGAGGGGRPGRQGNAPQGGPPRGGPGGARELPLMRGGGWDNPATFLRLSARYHYYGPTLRVSDVGFRVVREPVTQ